MKKLWVLLALMHITSLLYAAMDVHQEDSILKVLYQEIENRDTYYNSRELQIKNLKSKLANLVSPSLQERYTCYSRIFDEYKTYQYDSAHVYVTQMLDMAQQMGSDSLISLVQVDMVFAYTSAGLFTDADRIVNTINTRKMSQQQRAVFYHLCGRLYSDMSNYLDDKFSDEYAHLYHVYSDSVLANVASNTFLARLIHADQGDLDQKIENYTALLHSKGMESSEQAVVCSILGDFYRNKGDNRQALYYKAVASILDIRSATRETSAKKDIALIFYERGDIQQASFFIQLALEDANFYNTRLRKIEICDILPSIEHERYLMTVEQQRTLTWLVGIASVLCLLLFGTMFVIWRQMKVSRRALVTITENNQQIQQQYEQLSTTNAQLKESERIKDEYIGNTFYAYATYLERIEKIYRTVNRKLAVKQYDDLYTIFTDTDLQRERDQIYATFDASFLRLFPKFVRQYNELFEEKDRVSPQDNQSLTTEMRIFALIRLGITDTERIANFLNYSVNTINTYKTKAKKRSFVSNTLFEQRIMEF